MRCLVPILVALVACVHGYIHLREADYKQLLDRKGALSFNASTYNRLAWDDETNLLYVLAKEPARLTVFGVGEFGHLTEKTNIDLHPLESIGLPNDVELCRPKRASDTPRLAISFDDPTDAGQPGQVRLYHPMSRDSSVLTEIIDFIVGANPVDMEFAMDCGRLLVVSTGRPSQNKASVTDGEGLLSIVQLPAVLNENSIITVSDIHLGDGLQNADGTPTAELEALMAKNFRRWPIRDHLGQPLTVAQNIEPVSVEISPNGMTAYLALPKNNAIARVGLDLAIPSVTFFPMGRRAWKDFYMDASKADHAVHMENYRIYSVLQPRQVKWAVLDDTEWLISMESGFIDEIPEYQYKDWETGKSLMSNGVITGVDDQMKAKLLDDTRLGQAHISTLDGRDPTGQHIKEVYMFGGRGISIRDSLNLGINTSLVDNLERMSAQFYKNVFNTAFTSGRKTPQGERDETSPTYGPNLSVMETGYFNNLKVLFLGSGTSGMLYVYVLVPDGSCPQPVFHSVHRRGGTSSSWSSMYNDASVGDLGITDMLYIGQSNDHAELLVVTSAASNSVSVYTVQDTPEDLRRRRSA